MDATRPKVRILAGVGMVLALGLAAVAARTVVPDDDPAPLPTTAAPPSPSTSTTTEPVDPAVLGSLAFTDVTEAAGLGAPHSAEPLTDDSAQVGGATTVDYDLDGLVDVFLPRVGLPNLLYRNRGDGTFVDVAAAAGVAGPAAADGSDTDVGYASATWGDVDGDGRLDLFLTSSEATGNLLYRNEGDGTFADVTEASGLAYVGPPVEKMLVMGAAFGDHDADGDLDLVTAHWNQELLDGYGEEEPGGGPCRLVPEEGAGPPSPSRAGFYVNDGTGRFTEMSDALGLDFDTVVGFAPLFADYDGDGWADLFVAADFCTSAVYRNDGGTGFTEVTDELGLGTDENGMGSALEDVDGDGVLDWFVTSIYAPTDGGRCPPPTLGCTGNRLWSGRRDGPWRDVTDRYGVRDGYWGWGAALPDLDNDGDREVMMVNGYRGGRDIPPGSTDPVDRYFLRAAGNRTRLWLQTGSFPLPQVAELAGFTDRGDAKALQVFDYDRDGDLDVLVAHTTAAPVLYRNDLDDGAHWLGVVARDGPGGEPVGVGARVEVLVSDGGPRLVTEIRAGGSYGGAAPFEAHVGLGDVARVARVTVTWPDGTVGTVEDVAADQVVEISPGGLSGS